MHGQGLHSEIDETSTCMHTDKKNQLGITSYMEPVKKYHR